MEVIITNDDLHALSKFAPPKAHCLELPPLTLSSVAALRAAAPLLSNTRQGRYEHGIRLRSLYLFILPIRSFPGAIETISMIKTVTLLVKRDDWTREEFLRYWRDVHGPLARAVKGIKR